MKKSYPIILLCFYYLLAITSCEKRKTGEEVTGKITLLTPDPISPNYPLPLDTLINNLKLVELETNKNCLISEIFKMRINESYIYVFDMRQKTLFLFSHEGKFVRRLDSGQGPESPIEINDFTFDSDNNICILAARQLVVYDKDGNFIERRKIDSNYDFIEYSHPVSIAYLKGDYYLWSGSVGRRYLHERPEHGLYKLNRDLEVTGKYIILHRGIGETHRFFEFKDSLYILPTYLKDTILTATPEGVEKKMVIDFKDRAISKHPMVRDYTKDESAIAYELAQNTNLCMGIRNFIATDKYFYFQYRCQDNGYEVYSNIETGRNITGRYFNSLNNDYSFLFPATSYKNQFVFYSEAYRLVNGIKEYQKKGSVPGYLQDKMQQLQTIKEDANPVVFFVSIKEF